MTGNINKFYAIPSKTRLSDDTICNRGLQFVIDDDSAIKNSDGTKDCYVDISYSLNNQYDSFEGIISAIEDAYDKKDTAIISIYGDDELLYSSPIISRGMKSTDFKIDVSGVDVLKIHTACYNPDYPYSYYIKPCIAEARLLKK
ncbi:MAG: NPCBM/NEW2 domain-containing protein [Oscillospiraceae bacterium]|nr:NPCBM/NEW2 domain-containing protein [Oscillospiraceae bacterium]